MKNRFLLAFLMTFLISANSYATNPSGTIPVAFSLYKSASISSIQGFNFGKIVIDSSLLENGDNVLARFDASTDALSFGGEPVVKSLSVTGATTQGGFTLSGNGISGFTLTPPVGAAQSCTFYTNPSGESDSSNQCLFSSPVTLETGVTLGVNGIGGLILYRTGTSVKFNTTSLAATKTYLTTDANYTTPNKSYNLTLTVNY